ncbi:hypothetical protein BGZ99_006411 [Dissophora globulifera]|uniref:Cas12f1-like TNB domain-containing protein n=1 Tax=Dissophora globulifera TaxID=979702 RepID=A0A9P6REZ1_9FUNG|nr:hypothetical protein BGZ99_006411 [Dissophora globulifera]
MEAAHSIVERAIEKIAAPTNSVLYLDGHPSKEKQPTHVCRQAVRTKALERAREGIGRLQDRMTKKMRVRKQLFLAVKKNLAKAFQWTLEARHDLAMHLRKKGWSVEECPTEADLKIASDCLPGDIVLSQDSDMFIYEKISTVWRPISRERFLVYKVADVLAVLGINRVQLTVLGVVSRNDYTSNIASLGFARNFSVIKALDGDDPASMVQRYLSDGQVASKNTSNNTFDTSLRVFVYDAQTALQPELTVQSSMTFTHQSLHSEFTRLRNQYAEDVKSQQNTLLSMKKRSSAENACRHRSWQTFNRYRAIDQPAHQNSEASTEKEIDMEVAQSATPQKNTSRHRPRYSFKERTCKIDHEAPPFMKQYKWKPWKTPPESPLERPTADVERKKAKKKPTTAKKEKAVEDMKKVDLVRSLQWEHPTVTLDVGTMSANISRALSDEPDLAPEVTRCLKEAVRLAAHTKRSCQELIGRFIQLTTAPGMGKESDKVLFDHICPRISTKSRDDDDEEEEENEEEGEADDLGGKDSDQLQFVFMLLRHIYSGDSLGNTRIGRCVQAFISRVQDLGLLDKRDGTALKTKMPYSGSALLRSVASQLSTEFRRIYRNGSLEMHNKLKQQHDKGLLPVGLSIEIRSDLSAIENFVHLNQSTGNRRKLVSISPVAQPFILFSELELLNIFWQSQLLKEKLRQLIGPRTYVPSLADTQYWLSKQAPGFLVTKLLTDIGRGVPIRRKPGAPKSYNASTMSIRDLQQHLGFIRQEDFNPATYRKKGYLLRGSLRTDGFRFQLLAFKLRELNAVRYRRLPENVLPPRITSTVGGVDYYLTEVRNVVKTKQDVTAIWGCRPEQIKILGLDLGQACVVGASAIIPVVRHDEDGGVPMEGLCVDSISAEKSRTFYNVAVKQKAAYQSMFKQRRWLEDQKQTIPLGATESIGEIESKLPPARGADANFTEYIAQLGNARERFDVFYNTNNSVKKRQWDARKAHDAEFRIITERLLNVVGGSISRQRDEHNKVVIGVGLGQFSGRKRLSSLHTAFQSFFVKKARSLGYVVVGVNEYYTSKKCPKCQNFVGQVEIRRLYCKTCKTYMHRDVMAGHNICNVVRGHLLEQQRPVYLQPMDKNKAYPWMQEDASSSSSSSSSGSSSSGGNSSGSGSGIVAACAEGERSQGRKRAAQSPATGSRPKRA